jgi:hypothetical protein
MFARLVVKKLSALQMDYLTMLSTSSLAGVLYCITDSQMHAFDVWRKKLSDSTTTFFPFSLFGLLFLPPPYFSFVLPSPLT